MLKIKLASVFLLFTQACTTTIETPCPPSIKLSVQESEKLNQFILSHQFKSGCVTELLADQQENYVHAFKHCKTTHAQTLNYQQWLTVYQSCTAKSDVIGNTNSN